MKQKENICTIYPLEEESESIEESESTEERERNKITAYLFD